MVSILPASEVEGKILEGSTWGTHPILLSLTPKELETFNPD